MNQELFSFLLTSYLKVFIYKTNKHFVVMLK